MDRHSILNISERNTQTRRGCLEMLNGANQEIDELRLALIDAEKEIQEKDATIAQQATLLAEKDARIAELEQKIHDMIAQKPQINVDNNYGVISDTIQNLQPVCQSLSITTTEQLQNELKPSSSPTRRLSQIHQSVPVPSL